MTELLSYRREVIRKAVHMMLAVFGFFLLGTDFPYIPHLFVIYTVGYVIIDLVRIKSRRVGDWFDKFFGVMVRRSERNHITGATWAFVGITASVLLFDTPVVRVAILIIGISDALAALVGQKYGRTRLGDKTLEGSLTFFITSLAIVIFISDLPPLYSAGVAVFATLLELVSGKFLNDNLAVPLFTSAIITILRYLI